MDSTFSTSRYHLEREYRRCNRELASLMDSECMEFGNLLRLRVTHIAILKERLRMLEHLLQIVPP